jgi:hypothetical protein
MLGIAQTLARKKLQSSNWYHFVYFEVEVKMISYSKVENFLILERKIWKTLGKSQKWL